MKRISFSATTDQVLARTKTVTRRRAETWTGLQPGDRLLAVDRVMGFRKGQRPTTLAVIEVITNDVIPAFERDPWWSDLVPGADPIGECRREGFDGDDLLAVERFVRVLGRYIGLGATHYRRIEFRYVEGEV